MGTSGRGFKFLLLVLVLCFAGPLRAELWTVKIAAVKSGAGTLRNVQVILDWPQGASSGTLLMKAAALDFPVLGYKTSNVHWQCPLQEKAGAWSCAGRVSAAGSPRHRLALEFSPLATSASLTVGQSTASYRTVAAQPGRSMVQLGKVPVQWLEAYLAQLWAQGRWTGGELGGSIEVLAPERGPFQVNADLGLEKISMETPDGLLAAASMAGQLKVGYSERGANRQVDTKLTVRGGELLFDSLYVTFPQTPVQVHVLAATTGEAPWRLPEFSWRDPGVLEATGSATLDAAGSVAGLDLALGFGNLAVARDRYLSGFLAPAGFADMLLAGAMQANLQLREAAISAFDARLTGVSAVDTKARFTFAGVDGSLGWTRSATPVASALGWDSGALFGIGLGPARFGFESTAGELRLRSAVAVEALEGKLVLDHLRWQAPVGEAGARFQFGLSMQALDLGSLSQRLGWPQFTGTVAGRIPSARYENDILVLDGGLQMQLFGGSIDLGELSMERPFGIAPTLSADVGIQDIDLEPMTRVFGFGQITGRLDGHINDLRLVDWTPVAFDARLQTDRAWKGKRRISQRAVDNISRVGGSGVVAGLQTQVLKFFDDFGYEQIGLACKLKDNVCAMDGVGSAGNGYIIVAGAGIPRIQVVGFRRRVDWPTLVSRLQAATEGQTPVIQ